jgi:hypothetical protein
MQRISRTMPGNAEVMSRLLHTLVKVAIAALIVGTILAHFGITVEALAVEFGISSERFAAMLADGFAWALPKLVLGLVVILPLWALVHIVRPSKQSSD